MNLSIRLKKIADLLGHGATVYDVGCDHALLSCYLVLEDKANKVYAVDNKQGPLAKAKENIERYGLKDKVIPVLADGLDGMPADVDAIVIAGMGLNTLLHILEGKDLSQCKQVLVQINHKVDELREYINKHNWTILDESVVLDAFYYEIVVFNTTYHKNYSPLEIKYGPILLKRKEAIFYDYLKDRHDRLVGLQEVYDDASRAKEIIEISEVLQTIKKDA